MNFLKLSRVTKSRQTGYIPLKLIWIIGVSYEPEVISAFHPIKAGEHNSEYDIHSTCIPNFSGLLSTWSSESSVLILTLITLDRYVSIVQPFKEKTTSLNIAFGICIFLWIISFLLSYIPMSGVFYDYFGVTFYTGNGLCLPLHIHNPYDKGWEYSFLLFVLLNSMAFIFICFAYIRMLRVIQRSTLMIRSTQQKQDSLLAKRFALVVLTDFLCWAPIVLAKLVAIAGSLSCFHLSLGISCMISQNFRIRRQRSNDDDLMT